ncbi:hypothetical protein EGM88_15690 [Aureibaculum marinum]|uniref:Apea-like HEPN domain-containing protein n=1 Tax=Aureibaculum marinum TaxID=2487930 RepID=A0A3N4N873_9FLAO|nr:hypothetical protein [Aureibaculum marinum]RPD90367.1 hypothetical protein EGM88_15690 [Aureibaculum marinum]
MKTKKVSFVRYYEKDDLIDCSIEDLNSFIKAKDKEKIANLIYQRFYNRYIKIFTFKSSSSEDNKTFKKVYKNGFLILASSCIVIEAISSFIQGVDKTENGNGKNSYNIFFKKCSEYKNELRIFQNKELYKNIRNGILHQGETYEDFLVSRKGKLFENNIINATLFINHLEEFLKSYKKELIEKEWDDEIWDNCRRKLRHIINRSE